ncbi:MAG: hypothetical protein HYR62_07095 [Actinobacteria bacterium]|nr:hypothetical protein [Actinomycetota bacterium]MBI3685944.1 hypothetical protein [Actinomycetota bacterium]
MTTPPEPFPVRPRRRGVLVTVLLAIVALATLAVPITAQGPGTLARIVGGPAGRWPGLAQADASGHRPGAREFTTGDVADLLDRYADGIRRRDLPAVLTAVDPTRAALVVAQRRLFANLRQVGLTTFAYLPVDVVPPRPDPGHPGRYTTGTARAWRLMQIRGVDPHPAAQNFQVGLGVRGDHLVIQGLAPVTGPTGNRQPSPWDANALQVLRSGHVLVAGTADVAGQLSAVAADAEAAIADAGPCWPAAWQHTFTIFATGDRRAFNTWFRSQFTNTEFIGFEVGLPVVDGSGEVVAGQEAGIPQVVIDLPRAQRAALGVRKLLEHELTHAASGTQRNASTETWAIEGYADFVAFHNGTLRQAERGGAAYQKYHSTGGLRVVLPANEDFYGKNAPVNYDLAFLLFWYLDQRYGQAAVTDFFQGANRGGDAAATLQERFHITLAQFLRDWSAWTFQQLR